MTPLLPCAACPMHYHSSREEVFLIANLNLSLCNVSPLLLVLSLVIWVRRPIVVSLLTSFQIVLESDGVSPEPSFLQSKESQFLQSFFIGFELQTLHPFFCFYSLDRLQCLRGFLVVRGLKLNTVMFCTEHWSVQSYQGHAQRKDLPGSAGYTISDTSQNVIGFLGQLSMLLACVYPAAD